MAIAAISLLALVLLLWMNHRTLPVARPLVVLVPAGVLCPVDLVSRRSRVYFLLTPARAPPASRLPSNLETLLMDACANDSAEVFR